MVRNRELAKKCNVFKADLQAGNATTLVDLLLKWIGRGKPASVLTGILVYFLLPFVIGFFLAAILGEASRWRGILTNMRSDLRVAIWAYFGLFTATVTMFLANVYFHKITTVLCNYVLDLVESEDTLVRIMDWIDLFCKKKITWIGVTVLGGLVSTPIVASIVVNANGSFVGVGYIFTLFLFSAESTFFF